MDIVYNTPCRGIIDSREEFVKFVPSGRPQHLLAVDIITNMWQVVVPVHRNISYAIGSLPNIFKSNLKLEVRRDLPLLWMSPSRNLVQSRGTQFWVVL